eukprot:359804-Chlamydomonas_euryale.AAC.8
MLAPTTMPRHRKTISQHYGHQQSHSKDVKPTQSSFSNTPQKYVSSTVRINQATAIIFTQCQARINTAVDGIAYAKVRAPRIATPRASPPHFHTPTPSHVLSRPGGVPVLGSAASGMAAGLSQVGGTWASHAAAAVRAQLSRLGAGGAAAGAGCGVGLGYGYGAGLVLRQGLLEDAGAAMASVVRERAHGVGMGERFGGDGGGHGSGSGGAVQPLLGIGAGGSGTEKLADGVGGGGAGIPGQFLAGLGSSSHVPCGESGHVRLLNSGVPTGAPSPAYTPQPAAGAATAVATPSLLTAAHELTAELTAASDARRAAEARIDAVSARLEALEQAVCELAPGHAVCAGRRPGR